MFDSVTKELTIKGVPVKVHAFSTGEVRVKTKFKESHRKGFLAILDMLFDAKFTDWMPIWVWVIEHPEGIFIIDSGENSEINDADYFKSSGFFANWFNRKMFGFQIEREQEIDFQLQGLGINAKDVNALVLTHLHIDHTDGLKHFPNTKIVVNKKEWERPYGDLRKLYPTWLKPELISLDQSYKNFDHACFLTTSKDMVALETPGHTHANMSILLKTDQCDLLFVGDVCYEQKQIVEGRFSGANINAKNAAMTYQKILQLANTCNLLVLPTHDKEAAQRLMALDVIRG